MKTIRVTGIITIHDDEYDPGPDGPLTEEAFMEWSLSLGLDDIEFDLLEEFT